MRRDPRQVYPQSRTQSDAVAKLVDKIQAHTRSQVLAIVFLDEEGQVFVTPEPGHEAQVLRVMAGLDWRGAQAVAEEWLI